MHSISHFITIALLAALGSPAQAGMDMDPTGEIRRFAERRLEQFKQSSRGFSSEMGAARALEATLGSPYLLYTSNPQLFAGYATAEPGDLLRYMDGIEICFPVQLDDRLLGTIHMYGGRIPYDPGHVLKAMRWRMVWLYEETHEAITLRSLAGPFEGRPNDRLSVVRTPNAGSFLVLEDGINVHGMMAVVSTDTPQFLPPQDYYAHIKSKIDENAIEESGPAVFAAVKPRQPPQPRYHPPRDGDRGYIYLRRYFDIPDPRAAADTLIQEATLAGLDLEVTGDDLRDMHVMCVPNPKAATEAAARHVPIRGDGNVADTTWCVVKLRRLWSIRETASVLSNGIRIFGDVSGGFLAAVPGDKLTFLRTRPFVAWVTEYAPEMKLFPYYEISPDSSDNFSVVSLAGQRTEFRDALIRLGAKVIASSEGGYVVYVRGDRLGSIVALDWVFSVAPNKSWGL